MCLAGILKTLVLVFQAFKGVLRGKGVSMRQLSKLNNRTILTSCPASIRVGVFERIGSLLHTAHVSILEKARAVLSRRVVLCNAKTVVAPADGQIQVVDTQSPVGVVTLLEVVVAVQLLVRGANVDAERRDPHAVLYLLNPLVFK